MYNPQRCIPMAVKIGEIWRDKTPDWRFGQMMTNFQTYIGNDAFYITDDDFLTKLESYLNKF
jgi:hypothetical protein